MVVTLVGADLAPLVVGVVCCDELRGANELSCEESLLCVTVVVTVVVTLPVELDCMGELVTTGAVVVTTGAIVVVTED